MSSRGKRIWPHVSHGGRYKLGMDLPGVVSTGSVIPAVTFHLLTEGSDFLVTESGDFLDIEHV